MNRKISASYSNSYLPSKDGGKVLRGFFEEFPWLWAVSDEWSGLLLIRVRRMKYGCNEDFGYASYHSGSSRSEQTFWLKTRRIDGEVCERVDKIDIGDLDQSKPIKLLDLVCKALKQISPQHQLEFIVGAETSHYWGPSAMSDPIAPSHSYVIFKPPQGTQDFRSVVDKL